MIIDSMLWSLAVLLVASGVAKLTTRTAGESALNVLAPPALINTRLVRAGLPWLELVLAVLLVTGAGTVLRVTTAATTALFVAFTAFVTVGLRQGDPVSCGCFGALSRTPITGRTVVRNLIFVVLAATSFVATSTGSYHGPAFAPSWWAVGAALVPVVVLAAIVWAERSGSNPGAAGSTPHVPPLPAPLHSTPPPAGDQGATPHSPAEDEYHRLPIPFVTVQDGTGQHVSLREESRKGARALFGVSPGCSPCLDVMDRLERWQGQLGPVTLHAVVSRSDLIPLLPPGLRGNALIDAENTASRTFDVAGTPWAVVLGADQLLAGGPESGGPAVVDLLAQLEERFGAETHPRSIKMPQAP